MIFPPLLSIKNSTLTKNMCPVASSDRLLHSHEPQELSSSLAARGGGGDPFSHPFSVADSSIKLVESEGFLFLVMV